MMKPVRGCTDASAMDLYPGLSPEWAMISPTSVCSMAHPRPHHIGAVSLIGGRSISLRLFAISLYASLGFGLTISNRNFA
jgi:hypothetical protein